jgi:hypothetical protein
MTVFGEGKEVPGYILWIQLAWLPVWYAGLSSVRHFLRFTLYATSFADSVLLLFSSFSSFVSALISTQLWSLAVASSMSSMELGKRERWVSSAMGLNVRPFLFASKVGPFLTSLLTDRLPQ